MLKIIIHCKAKALLLVFFSLSLLISSCTPPPPTKQGVSFYLALTPLDAEQADLTAAFLSMIEGNASEKTKIITHDNYYRIAELCNADTASILLPGVKLSEDSENNRRALLSSAVSSLSEIRGDEKIKDNIKRKCLSTPTSLIDVIKKVSAVSNTVEKEGLVLLAQAPWSEDQFTPKILAELTSANIELSGKRKVKKIVLFGVDPKSVGKISKTFEVFNLYGQTIFESAAVDRAQINLKLEHIRSKVLLSK
jgi:hypothetical protein